MAEAETDAPQPRSTRTLCLGEALVDLICEQPVASLATARAFSPHSGGAVANVAVHAARAGAHVSLVGGVGADGWGDWLTVRLADWGVDLSLLQRLPGVQTTIALSTVDADGIADYAFYGDSISRAIPSLGDALEPAIADSAALFFTSNSLVAADERAVTMRARELALANDVDVIFDANFRIERWSTKSDAQASADACVPGALLVRANRFEAAVMTGEDDPERAASALLKAGARMVVITLGSGGAIMRGEFRADVDAVEAHVVSTIGAGDAFTGTLLARFALSGFYPPALPAALREAAAAAARACEHWGAID